MKILVTGATGFLGSHLVKALLKEKHQVIILKRTFSDTWRIEDVLDQVITYDIDKCELKVPFEENGHIDAVFHTATCYGRKKESAVEIQWTNTKLPLELLETAVIFNTDTFFNTDTILPKYLNYYALTKKQFAEWGKLFVDMQKINFINLKLEHIYGPMDDASKFVAYVKQQCLDNEPELDLTKGEQKRDFIYIDDVVNAYMILLQKKYSTKKIFEEYAVGTGDSIAIKEVVLAIHRMAKSKTKLNFGAIPYRENEIMESHADIKKLKLLGWNYFYSLENGIKKLFEKKG